MADEDRQLIKPVAVLDGSMTVAELRRLAGEVGGWESGLVLLRVERHGTDLWFAFSGDVLSKEIQAQAETAALAACLDLPDDAAIPARQVDAQPVDDREVLLDGTRPLGLLIPPPNQMAWSAPPPRMGALPPEESPPEGETAEEPAAEAEPPEAAAPEPFRAWPNLQAPEQVRQEEWFDLEISLSPDQADGTHGAQVEVELPSDVQQFDLQVQVLAEGFESASGWRHVLTVDRKNPGAKTVFVKLKATAAAEQHSSLRVHFAYKGQPCGNAYRNITVYKPAEPEPAFSGRENVRIGVETPTQPVVGEVRVVQTLAPADLVLTISGGPADRRYQCYLSSPHDDLQLADGNFPIELDPEDDDGAQFTGTLVESVEGMLGAADRSLLPSTLQGNARRVARLLPDEFWAALERVCDHVAQTEHREATLLICSGEYQIAWELAYFKRDPNRPPFLGAQLAMGRWYIPDGNRHPGPEEQVAVASLAVVWSDYKKAPPPWSQLKYAALEADCLREKYHAADVPARQPEIMQIIQGDQISTQVLHFACHGLASATTTKPPQLILESGPPYLTPANFLGGDGPIARDRPFIFLNACQVGQAKEVLAANMGFTGAFLEQGCRGCVAPLWKVIDSTAGALVAEFYRRTLDEGQTVGEALRELRRGFATGDPKAVDPTCMAYVYYGHPNLVLKRV